MTSPKPKRQSLRQLLLGVTLLVCGGGWYYLHFIYAIPLTPESNLLADYVGKRVTFTGRFEDLRLKSQSEYVYFGSEPIALHFDRNFPDPNSRETISVTGTLVIADWSRYRRRTGEPYCLQHGWISGYDPDNVVGRRWLILGLCVLGGTLGFTIERRCDSRRSGFVWMLISIFLGLLLAFCIMAWTAQPPFFSFSPV